MYVTVACGPTGQTAVYAPAPTTNPPTPPDNGGPTYTTPPCPSSGVDRTTEDGDR